ncbi:gpW family head-tail joining protein [Desulfoluna spongiiphila]|uniref:gpW family head-tail joining protein n=1 Tax=Desulfoluna spongiiphila TaxID=419481 RepID=UPI001255A70B|nr:gpW family head-tail joining protein [Desulfoluna spongiiphila]VVS95346.1 head-to-tail joining protein w [Desulfoluna spongiiphila]
MAYTQDDLSAVQAAVIALATGKRAVRVVLTSGKTIEYDTAGLDDLKTLRAEIQAELNAAAGKRRFFRTVTSKGL